MPLLAKIKLKLKAVLAKLSPFHKKKTRFPTIGYPSPLRVNAKTRPDFCLACQSVRIQGVYQLCSWCQLSPYLPQYPQVEGPTKKDQGQGGETGVAPGEEGEAKGESSEEGPAKDKLLKGEFPDVATEGIPF